MDDVLLNLEQHLSLPRQYLGSVVDHIQQHYGHLLPTLPSHQLVARLNIFVLLLIGSEALAFYSGSVGFKSLASLTFFLGGLERAFESKYGANAVALWPRLVKEVLQGKLENKYSQFMIIGLAFSVLGDISLIPSRDQYFSVFGPQPKPKPAQIAAVPETPSKKTKKERKGQKKDQPEAAAAAVKAQEADTADADPGMWFKAGMLFFALAHVAYTVAFVMSPTGRSLAVLPIVNSLAAAVFPAWMLGLFDQDDERSILKISPKMQPLVKGYTAVICVMVAAATATDEGFQKILGAWMFLISDLFVAVDVFGAKRPPRHDEGGRPGWMLRSVGWAFYFAGQMILAGTVV